MLIYFSKIGATLSAAVIVLDQLNKGSASSLAASLSDPLLPYGTEAATLFGGLLLGIIGCLMLTRQRRGVQVASGLIFGGGFTNLMDRLAYAGAVADPLTVASVATNIADLAIIIGSAIIVITIFAGLRHNQSSPCQVTWIDTSSICLPPAAPGKHPVFLR